MLITITTLRIEIYFSLMLVHPVPPNIGTIPLLALFLEDKMWCWTQSRSILPVISRTMPTDNKRVRGPDVSQSPTLFLCKPADVVHSHGPRADGRQLDQVDIRPVFVRCGMVSQAKGSAYIEAGKTKVMCCVYGPRETERKDETDMKCGRYVVFKSMYLKCIKLFNLCVALHREQINEITVIRTLLLLVRLNMQLFRASFRR